MKEIKSSKWKEVKNEIQKTWGLLTHDEIESAKGSLLSLVGAIQKKYGMARHEAIEKLSHFVDRLSKTDIKNVQIPETPDISKQNKPADQSP